MAPLKKKAKTGSSTTSKQPPTKCNWLFSAEKLTLRELNAICFQLFTKEGDVLAELFDYAIVATSKANNAYKIFGYFQLKISSRWTSKQVVDYLGHPVRTYGSNDAVFGVIEKQLKPKVIILKLKALSGYGFVTESGSVRSKGKKSQKRTGEDDDGGDFDDDEEEDGEEDEEEDDELSNCDLFIKKSSAAVAKEPEVRNRLSSVASPASSKAFVGPSNESSRRSNAVVARAAPNYEEEEVTTSFVSNSNNRTENRFSNPPFYDMSTSPARLVRAPRGTFDPVSQRNNTFSNSFISYQDQLVGAIGSLLDSKLEMRCNQLIVDVNTNITEIMQAYLNADIGNTTSSAVPRGTSPVYETPLGSSETGVQEEEEKAKSTTGVSFVGDEVNE